jgi:hypothetical protein
VITRQAIDKTTDELQLLESFPKVVQTAAQFNEPDWSPPLYNIWTFKKNGQNLPAGRI